MNEANYASLEASKRLVAAGIVIKTDCFWFDKGDDEWCIEVRDYWTQSDVLSAPCMAEVWRELPATLRNEDDPLVLNKALRIGDGVQVTSASYDYSTEDYGECTRKFFASTNPTDSLIDLLIWQRKEANHEPT